jgi:hypothetical protein
MKRLLSFAVLLYVPCSSDLAWAEPRQMLAEDLAAITGGLLDFYYIAPVVVVSSTNSTQAGASQNSAAQAASTSTINVVTNINLTSITGLVNQQQPAAGGVHSLPNVQMPVWVPWQQQLRPLGSLLGTLAQPTP